jgi:hypothetical protein
MAISKEEVLDAWNALGAKILAAAEKLLEQAELGDQNDPQIDVKISAVAVLCRTVKNFTAMRLGAQVQRDNTTRLPVRP